MATNRQNKKVYKIGQKVFWQYKTEGMLFEVEIIDISQDYQIFTIKFGSGKTYRATKAELDEYNEGEWKMIDDGEDVSW